MRFIVRVNGNPHVDYVIRPAQIQFSPLGTRLPNTLPIRAVFKNGLFDSEVAEREENWLALSPDPEKDPHAVRRTVEEYLLAHKDMNGGGLYVEGMQPKPEAQAADGGALCEVKILGPDGSTVICGHRVERDGMCIEHAARFLAAQSEGALGSEPKEEAV